MTGLLGGRRAAEWVRLSAGADIAGLDTSGRLHAVHLEEHGSQGEGGPDSRSRP